MLEEVTVVNIDSLLEVCGNGGSEFCDRAYTYSDHEVRDTCGNESCTYNDHDAHGNDGSASYICNALGVDDIRRKF